MVNRIDQINISVSMYTYIILCTKIKIEIFKKLSTDDSKINLEHGDV